MRYFLLASHYRSELNFSNGALDQAWDGLRRCYRALLDQPVAEVDVDHPVGQRYRQAMNDDFNTPEALAVMFDLVRDLNSASAADQPQLAAQLRTIGDSMGLLQHPPQEFLRLVLAVADDEALGLDDQQVETLLAERLAARADKNWTRADEIREQLAGASIVLEDAGGETRWSRR